MRIHIHMHSPLAHTPLLSKTATTPGESAARFGVFRAHIMFSRFGVLLCNSLSLWNLEQSSAEKAGIRPTFQAPFQEVVTSPLPTPLGMEQKQLLQYFSVTVSITYYQPMLCITSPGFVICNFG
jgi:hypothetical protein